MNTEQKLNFLIDTHNQMEIELIETLEEKYYHEEKIAEINKDMKLQKLKRQKIMIEIKKLSQLLQ